eukprot:4689580-Ditylum_brightwellii.AAC.1
METQQSAGIGQEEMEYNSTISRDWNGAKQPCSMCLDHTEQIIPNTMCATNGNPIISRDWTGGDGV